MFPVSFTSYLTVPSETPGTERVTSRGIWHWLRRMLTIRRASTSLRGAFTDAQPKYVSLLNTTLSSSGTGVPGLESEGSSTGRDGWRDTQSEDSKLNFYKVHVNVLDTLSHTLKILLIWMFLLKCFKLFLYTKINSAYIYCICTSINDQQMALPAYASH